MELLNRLEARHDELLAQLDELDAQIVMALSQFNRGDTANPVGDNGDEGSLSSVEAA